MSDVAVLLAGAPERVTTVRAVLSEWSDPAGARAAIERVAPGAGAHLPGDAPSEHVSRHWFAAPDRVREERAGAVTIRHGDTWWIEDPRFGAIGNHGDPQQTTTAGELIRRWVAPGAIVSRVRLRETGRATVAGRAAVRAGAVPRSGPGADAELSFLGSYAESWELDVDAERGILLATAAFSGTECFEAVEAMEIAFDEELADDLFRIPG